MPQVEMCDGGRRRVMWQGCLTDWELAKYIPKDTALQRARQPERTVRCLCLLIVYVRAHPSVKPSGNLAVHVSALYDTP